MDLLESRVIGKAIQHPILLSGKSKSWVLCTFRAPKPLRLPLLHACESVRGCWHTDCCRVVIEDSCLHTVTGISESILYHTHTRCSTGALHRFLSSPMDDSWKWRWRGRNAMKPQYCSKLGSRWQTFLQQYGGLSLRLPWLLLSCLICLSLTLFCCDSFLQGNATKMPGFRHSFLSGELSFISIKPFRAN